MADAKYMITNWFQTDAAYEFYQSLPELFIPIKVETPHARCVGYVTVEKNPIYTFFTRRAIIVGGPEIREGCTPEEVTELMTLLVSSLKGRGWREAPIYIETRNFNDYSPWRTAFERAGFVYEEHLNFHLDCSNEEQLLKNMHDSLRRHVKKGLKCGSVIEEAQSEQDVKDFYKILRHLYQTRVKTPLFPEAFFLQFYRDQIGKILLVKYEGKVIGGIVCPILHDEVIYEWYVCGQDEQYKDQYPSVLATYAAMLYGAQHNLPRFDFMGAGTPQEPYGVREFKAEFGGQLVEHGRFKFIHNRLLYKFGELGVKILKLL